MGLSLIASGTYLPTALTTQDTIFTDTTVGLKQFIISQRNLPAGSPLNLSFQTLILSSSSYDEYDNDTLEVAVAIPAAPALGYAPVKIYSWEGSLYGLQIIAQILSGSLPTTGLTWALYGVS